MDLKALTPVPWENIYHIGVIVEDLRTAMAEMADQTGITWGNAGPVTVTVRDHRGVAPETLQVVYGKNGPPYLELIEGTGKGVWALEGGPRLHHMGIWTDTLAADIARLEGQGMRTEASGVGPDGQLSLFAYMKNAHGLRLELVDSANRAASMQRLIG